MNRENKMKPGDVVTLSDRRVSCAAKAKDRPAVVVLEFPEAILVAPITDARKKLLPTHHKVNNYNSGTEVKDALVITEHSCVVPYSAVSPRPLAHSLANELEAIRYKFRVALGLESVRAPARAPKLLRLGKVSVDFGSQPHPLVSGVTSAVVVSNNQGNAFGEHFIVIPSVEAPTEFTVTVDDNGCEIHLDMKQMKAIDASHLQTDTTTALSAGSEDKINNALSIFVPA